MRLRAWGDAMPVGLAENRKCKRIDLSGRLGEFCHVKGSSGFVSAFFAFQNQIAKIGQKAVFIFILLNLYIAASSVAQVSGTVFRDFNGNGTKDTYEPGAAGVTVKAYNAAGTQLGATATSSSTGAWSITTGTSATVRVEFKLPTTNSNPVGPLAGQDYSAPGGSVYGSSIQFVAGNATGVNYALMDPYDYWDAAEDHRYVMSCFVNGLTSGSGSGANDAAVVSTPASSSGLNNAYSNDLGAQGTGPNPRMDAIISQVGAVWGAAYYKAQKHFYFATFLKRHCGMADGPGYIYNFDYSSGTPTSTGKFNLQGATPTNGGSTIDLGTVTRTGGSDYTLPTNKTTPNIDLDAFGKVGAISFGDIDMQPGTGYLWAVNLYQKALIRVDVSGNPTSLPSDVQQYLLSSLPGYPTSTTGVLRPWALAFNAGKGYLGVIADASISKADADLKAYVLQFDPNNITAGFTTILNFDPNIKRSGLQSYEKFHYWLNTYAEPPVEIVGGTGSQKRAHTQPVLSDIDFDENGNMMLSFFDRFGHQMGYFNYKPLSGSNFIIRVFGYGEILKACANGTGWTIEGTGTCHTGAEFFTDTAGDGEVEGSEGGSAILKGKNQLMEISIDPHPDGSTGQTYWSTQGVNTYSLTSGLITNWYSVYHDATATLYGKANGLGDMEFIVDEAPIEIGNRVWNDTDKDGVQDADEAGIGNVTLELYPDFNNDGSPDAITSSSPCETKALTSGVNTACSGAVNWSNPGNAISKDGVYATAALSSTNLTTHCLQVTGAGFNIPTNATINGITVTITRRASAASSARDNTVQLLVGGTASGTNLATTTSWPTTAAAATYGSSTSLWGLTLTPAQVNASNFGVNIRASRTNNSPTVSVDHVEISVCYTTAAGTYAIATTTTASSGAVGTWYFNTSNVLDGDPTTSGSQPGLAANKTYLVRVGSSDWTSGAGVADLSGFILTTINNASGADQPDEIDSDAALSSSIPQISVTTGGVGQANHSLDMGFWNCATITNPSAAQSICAGSAGTNITVNTNQNAANSIKFVRFTSAQTNAATIYAGSQIGSTVTPTGGASPYTATYTFNTADFPNSTTSPITYYVYAILNPDPGASCRPYQEIQVTSYPVATANAGTAQTICVGSTVNLSGSIGGAATSATWSAPSGSFSNINSLTSNYTPSITSGSVTLTLTSNDPTGPCSAAVSTVVITINNVTASTVSGSQTICSSGDPAAFTVTSAATGAGTLTYQWQSNTTTCAGVFTDIAGATSATYDPPSGLTVTTNYRVKVTSTLNALSCTATSNCLTVSVNNVSASAVGSNQTVCSSGDPATFTVTTPATGSGTLTYQWQKSTTSCSADFVNISGATSSTYNPPGGLTQTTYYRVVVTSTLNGVGCSATSNCITVTALPFCETYCANNTLTNSGFENNNLPGSGTFSFAGGTAVNLGTAAPVGYSKATSNGDNYWVQSAKAHGGNKYIYMYSSGTTPASTDACTQFTKSGVTGNTTYNLCIFAADAKADGLGSGMSLEVRENTSGPFHWMNFLLPNNPSWSDATATDIPWAQYCYTFTTASTTNTLTMWLSASAEQGGTTAYVVVDDLCLEGTTIPQMPTIGGSTNTAATCTGGTVNNDAGITLTGITNGTKADKVIGATYAGGPALGAGTNVTVSGGNAVFTGLAANTQYTFRVWNSECDCYTDITLTTPTTCCVSASVVGSDQGVCAGGNPAAFTVTSVAAGNGTLSYQWQSSTTNCTTGFSNISGANSDTYDPPSGFAQTTYYRVVVTNTVNGTTCTATSNCVTVTLNIVTASTISSNQTICSGGDPAAFTVAVAATGSGALTYQWQSGTGGCAGSFTNISGATSATYDPPSGLSVTTYYRVVVTSTLSGVGCTATSNCLTVTVNSVTASTIGSDQAICSGGDPATITALFAATGSGALTYQWQSGTGGCSGSFSNIAGATSATYNPPGGLTSTTYYRVVVGSVIGASVCMAISNCVTVTVNPYPDFTLGLAAVCPGQSSEVTIGNITNGNAATSFLKVNSGSFVPYFSSPPNLTVGDGIIINATNTITVRNQFGCDTVKIIAVPNTVPLVCPPIILNKISSG